MLVRHTPTAHVQQTLDLCRTFYTLRPASCSFWSFLCCISYSVKTVVTIHGFLPLCVLGQSSLPTSRQSNLYLVLLHSTGLPSAFPAISLPLSLHFACSALLFWPILRSSVFPPPHLLWCDQLVLGVVGPASFLSLQHIFARLSQEIAILYGLLTHQTLVQVPLLDLALHTNIVQP